MQSGRSHLYHSQNPLEVSLRGGEKKKKQRRNFSFANCNEPPNTGKKKIMYHRYVLAIILSLLLKHFQTGARKTGEKDKERDRKVTAVDTKTKNDRISSDHKNNSVIFLHGNVLLMERSTLARRRNMYRHLQEGDVRR